MGSLSYSELLKDSVLELALDVMGAEYFAMHLHTLDLRASWVEAEL